jgi:hypothetical protein
LGRREQEILYLNQTLAYLFSDKDRKAAGVAIKLFLSCNDFNFLSDSRPVIFLMRLLERSKYSRETAFASPAVLEF